MGLAINDAAPDFEADTTHGRISFHEWIADSWAVLFSHPKDFTPVCTTELGQVAKLAPEFERRGVKVIGLSASTMGHIRDHVQVRWYLPGWCVVEQGEAPGELFVILSGEAEVWQEGKALSAYRSQFPLQPGMFPQFLLEEMFGREYFVACAAGRPAHLDEVPAGARRWPSCAARIAAWREAARLPAPRHRPGPFRRTRVTGVRPLKPDHPGHHPSTRKGVTGRPGTSPASSESADPWRSLGR
jgi:AhpC/TSA family